MPKETPQMSRPNLIVIEIEISREIHGVRFGSLEPGGGGRGASVGDQGDNGRRAPEAGVEEREGGAGDPRLRVGAHPEIQRADPIASKKGEKKKA